jgi:ribosome biogenesis GTPase
MSATQHMPQQPAATAATFDNPDNQPRTGLVIVNYGKNLLVEDAAGELFRCVSRRGIGTAVCGDRVRWLRSGDGEGVVEAIDERRTLLQRTVGHGQHKPLAANIDQVVIEAATEPAFDSYLIDKYTIAAELAAITPLIVINKCDLLTDSARREIERLLQEYQAIGYRCLFTSARYNTGIEAFRAELADHTSILVGQSGVGKSSLARQLLPELEITTGKLSAASGQGKHTTTATTLYHLPGGGSLIDSPGVRDFHLGKVDHAELGRGFREFHPWLGQCRFRDCLHKGEPGCAIDKALAEGHISARRMDSYRRLLALFL